MVGPGSVEAIKGETISGGAAVSSEGFLLTCCLVCVCVCGAMPAGAREGQFRSERGPRERASGLGHGGGEQPGGTHQIHQAGEVRNFHEDHKIIVQFDAFIFHRGLHWLGK